jgi:hypothetical protein
MLAVLGSQRRRRGAVVVLVALLLVALLGMTAVAVDAGFLQEERRHAQGAADAAALAGATVFFNNYQQMVATNGYGPIGQVQQAVNDAAQLDGYTNANSTITMNVAPSNFQEGPWAGQAIPLGYIEVIIVAQRQRGFSAIWDNTTNLTIRVHAVARGTYAPIHVGIMALDPVQKSSFWTTGGGTVNITGGAGVIVNSNDPGAAANTGGGTVNIAGSLQVTGIPGTNGNFNLTGGGTIQSGVPPTPDPLRLLPQPDPTNMPVYPNNAGQVSGQNQTQTFQPGNYPGGFHITAGSGTITLAPGIYYVNGFDFNANCNLIANGVMIFNTGNSAVSINAGGSFQMTPMTSGTYQGISLFQSRSCTTGLSVTGNGNMNMTGTFYAATALLTVAGNGSNNVIGSQYITDAVKIAGNGAFNINWTPQGEAPIRHLNLVQ